MKKSTYCFWLMASAAAGNKLTKDECQLLNSYMNNRTTR